MSALVHAVTQLALAEARRALGSLRRALSPDAVDALFCALLAAQWPVAREILSPVIAEDVPRPAGDVQALLALLVVVERCEEVAGPLPAAPTPILPPPPDEGERSGVAAWAASMLTHVDVADVGDRGVAVLVPCEAEDCDACDPEARLEMWPAAAPTLPWQLDHALPMFGTYDERPSGLVERPAFKLRACACGCLAPLQRDDASWCCAPCAMGDAR